MRLFAEEVAEAAAEGKESGLEPEEWTKINDTVNSIQLCLFLLREPYLSPTQGTRTTRTAQAHARFADVTPSTLGQCGWATTSARRPTGSASS